MYTIYPSGYYVAYYCIAQLIAFSSRPVNELLGLYTTYVHTHSLTNLCLAGSLLPDSPMITLRALPGLIRLCKREFPLSLRTPAISALGVFH